MMKRLLLVFFLVGFSIPAFSQFFQPSSIPETFMSGTESHDLGDVTCYSYNNLLFDDGIQSDLYISTWYSGSVTGLYRKRTHYGDPYGILEEDTLSFPNPVHGAVILGHMRGIPNVYCVAVVHRNIIGFYEWSSFGFNLILEHAYTSDYVANARIDAVGLNYYAVVWEDGNGNMSSFGGAVNHPGISLINDNVSLDLPGTSAGYRPDLAINRGSIMGFSGLKVYYTYINDNMNEVHVSFVEFDDLSTGPANLPLNLVHTITSYQPNTPPIISPSPVTSGFFYSSPKIDAPDNSGDRWAIVVYDIDFQTNLNRYEFGWIRTAFNVAGIIDTTTLNTGSLNGTADMSNNGGGLLFHSRPSVAFDKNGYHIHYAWGKTQNHLNLDDAHDYIGLMLDPGAIDAVLSPSGAGYRIIDYTPELIPHVRIIALSPQNVNADDLFIAFEARTTTIGQEEALYYKHVDWNDIPAIGYSAENPNAHNDDKEGLIYEYFPNPIENRLTIILNEPYLNDELWMGIYNIDGKQIDEFKGYINDINKFLDNYFIENNRFSLGFIQLKSLNSKKSETIKFLKQ